MTTDTAPLSERLRNAVFMSRDTGEWLIDQNESGIGEEAADALDALSARVKDLEVERERWKGTVRELSAACQKRAEERDDARGSYDNKCMDDMEHRESMAGALGMSWDGCDPFEWPEIIARGNELRTTLKMRPEWKARATQAEADRDALRAAQPDIARELAEALNGVFNMAGNYIDQHLMQNPDKDPDIIRAAAALAKARAAGILPEGA
ncbi:hypothetical protein [Azospirillum rugosum]|uniref:Ead/Ea22-like family protein n=1 Tax=Azospirillum rugosum TaxID=416170 RepID=A0ABS4SDX1_9PROT|nr:hypothetical protein [Azospirillum rugosum]MBP2290766.1 hypothetical protein [Azospirillum rugosum]MDQ0525655.1 hypothetical protein [Azospirillum rugosum]